MGKPRAVRAQLRQEVPQELHNRVHLNPGQQPGSIRRLENLLSISLQEEECDEVFRKICYIEMVDTAQNVSTEVCRRPLVKDCDLPGEEICRTEFQSECWSKRIPHEVRKSQYTGHLSVSECVSIIVRKVKTLYTLQSAP